MPFWKKKSDPSKLHQQGVEAFEQGNVKKAFQRFSEAIEAEPTSERLYYRGVLNDIMQNQQAAIKDLKQATTLDPTNSQAWYSQSVIHQQMGNDEAAFNSVKRAYDIDADDFRIANVYARMLFESPFKEHLNPNLAVKISKHACDLTQWEDAICVETHQAALASVGQADQAAEIETPDRDNLAAPAYSEMADFPDITQDLIKHFETRFKRKANELALQNIIPISIPIAVQTIESKKDSGLSVVFTTGMSAEPMKVSDPETELKYAEFFMVVPGNCRPPTKIDDSIWPWHSLQILANTPHIEGSAYSRKPQVFCAGDSPEQLGSNTEFAAFLLLPSVKGYVEPYEVASNKRVQFIAVVPIYKEEYALGAQQLLTRFKESKTKPHFTPGRPNLAI